ncbi:uncharacterized protein MELLADRAFT_58372 [Melampsora larici-populina 98AG31]|uniref:Uncharacterized protein n=1 Tax=Melampsora larici-populina (strain 98AG31 / pathotype 3-4-7) TaxID=747676 RepID=F4R392_MELLP|nr:uncharacterized protein MELLADRAFT_58372 [Melampsora larici-populina 98AG31]EGG12588.1 hypothetical protein MELLADRAFT_58372 [Melampsora larici-populina 98AG31]
MATHYKKTFPLYINSIFDVIAIGGILCELSHTRQFAHMVVTTDPNHKGLSEWALRGVVNGEQARGIVVDGAYFLSGILLGNNHGAPEYFEYTLPCTFISKTPPFHPAEVVNSVGVTGYGTIIEVFTVAKSDHETSICLSVEHCNFNRDTNEYISFLVRFMGSTPDIDQSLLTACTPGKEILITGSIVDRDLSQNTWLVKMNYLALVGDEHRDHHQETEDGLKNSTL